MAPGGRRCAPAPPACSGLLPAARCGPSPWPGRRPGRPAARTAGSVRPGGRSAARGWRTAPAESPPVSPSHGCSPWRGRQRDLPGRGRWTAHNPGTDRPPWCPYRPDSSSGQSGSAAASGRLTTAYLFYLHMVPFFPLYPLAGPGARLRKFKKEWMVSS